jgi:hypothetical protein
MRKMIALAVLCIVSAAASAQSLSSPSSGSGTRMERALAQLQTRFASANTTHDGKLTRAQAEASMPIVARHFDEIDTQRNGFITLAQIEDFMRQRAQAQTNAH